MKTSMFLFAVAAMVPVVTANFDIYFSSTGGFFGGSSTGWVAFDSDPDCDEAGAVDVFEDRSDVSGDKYGIRCEGDGCGYHHGSIDVMEIHTNEYYHYTIYKERDYKLIGLHGETEGECMPYPHNDIECEVGGGLAGRHKSFRKIRCLTHFNSADLYA